MLMCSPPGLGLILDFVPNPLATDHAWIERRKAMNTLETVLMMKDHRRIVSSIKRRAWWFHGRIHIAGVMILAVSLIWPIISKQKLDLVTSAYGIVKKEFGMVQARQRLLSLLRTKPLTLAQGLDVCDMIMEQKEVPVSLALALFETESDFNPKAVSHKGARGLGQLHGVTAKAYAGSYIHDPITNVRGSLEYLADLKRTYGQWPEALRSYNGGPANRYNKALDPYVKTVLAKAEKYQKGLDE